MNDDFNWLEYVDSVEEAPGPAPRRGLRRFLPRLPLVRWRPRLPRLPRLGRPRLPRLRLPRRGGDEAVPSAADLVEAQAERPIAELDDRLLALRERSQPELQRPEPALADVDELLVTPEIQTKPGGVISGLALSLAQQQQVEMLQDIVGGAPEGETGEAGIGRGRWPRAGFSLGGAMRGLLSAALLLVVSLPFVSSDFAEGELPPADFGENRPSSTTFYDLLDNLSSDDYVLLALEYGPTSAGELDLLTDLFLRHIFAQRATPLIVSSNPIAIVHAQNILKRINRSVADTGLALENGRDYHVLRYLPGGALGLRELSENFADVVRVSARGALTGLEFARLDEMTSLLLVAESVDVMRAWVEQVLPEVEELPLLVATGYAAQPLAQVYIDSNDRIIGPVVGMRDAYTYARRLQTTFSDFRPAQPAPDQPEEPAVEPAQHEAVVEPAQRETVLEPAPTAVPTLPEIVNQPPQQEPGSEAQAEVDIPTPLVAASATPGTPTATITATSAPTATPPPTATPESILLVEVNSNQQVRIRRGPTTADDILQLAREGDVFEVIGANGDGSWYNIALAEGLNGWIASFLVDERTGTRDELSADATDDTAGLAPERTVLRLEYRLSLGKPQPRFYQANPPDLAIDWEYALLRDRALELPRLQALTLGTIAAALVILIGGLSSALQAFQGRRRAQPGE